MCSKSKSDFILGGKARFSRHRISSVSYANVQKKWHFYRKKKLEKRDMGGKGNDLGLSLIHETRQEQLAELYTLSTEKKSILQYKWIHLMGFLFTASSNIVKPRKGW